MFQILYPFLDLPICTQLLTDGRNRIFLTSRKHIILDELSCPVGHPKSNGTFFHRHQTSRVNSAKDGIIHCVQISLFGWVNAVHIHSSPIFLGLAPLIQQSFQLFYCIGGPPLRQIFIFRHLPRMAEEAILLQIQIISSYFKSHPNTSRQLTSGICNLQYNLRTEVYILSIRSSVLLSSTKIA